MKIKVISMKYLIDLHHGFGDLVHMIPAIRMIQNNDKEAEISIIVSTQANIDIFRTQNLANEFWILNVKELLKKRISNGFKTYDYGIIAPCIMNQTKSELLLRFFSCKKILKEDKDVRNEIKHRVDKNIAVIEKLGYKRGNPYPQMVIPEKEKKFAIDELSKNRPEWRIGICIGGNYETLKKGRKRIKIDIKRWPVEYYHKLIRLLKINYPNIDILLIGGKKDSEEFWSYNKNDRIKVNDVRDYMGKTTMLQSGALLEQCDLAFGNDTGMIHLAASLGKTTMTIFCSTNPKKIGAYANNAIYIEEYLPCKYCYLSEKTFECVKRECITQISPEKAFEKINTFIKSEKCDDD